MVEFFSVIGTLFISVYIVVIVIFSKVKKYNAIKLICSLTILWTILSIIFAFLIFLITGGTINTVKGVESSLFLSIILGIIIGWGISLGSIIEIERIGNAGASSIASDIIKNGNNFLIIRLFQALIMLLFGTIIRLIYNWSKIDRTVNRTFSKKDKSKQKETIKQEEIVKENINNTDKLKEIVLSQNYTDEIRESALNHIHIRDREQIKDMIDNGNLPENIKNKVKARYDYFLQRAKENQEFDIKIMNPKDARELVEKTENAEELKMIIKARFVEKSYFSQDSAVEYAQHKLRRILGYSLDEYYCPKCDKIIISVRERINMYASDAGNIHFNLKCPHCNSRLGETFINENW